MTPQSAATVLVADALERGLPIDDGLSSVRGIPRIEVAAKRGDVSEVLKRLSVDELLIQVAQLWPRAFAPALRRCEALPGSARFSVHVLQTASYVFFLALVQVAIGAVLTKKVYPVLEAMGRDYGTPSALAVSMTTAAVFALGMVPLVVWLAAGATGWERLPGWGRELRRAKEAAIAAAVLESQPPDDVRLQFYARVKWLGDATLDPVDLSLLAEQAAVDAERALARFLTAARFVSLGLLTLNAFGMLASVYVTLAHLSGVGQ